LPKFPVGEEKTSDTSVAKPCAETDPTTARARFLLGCAIAGGDVSDQGLSRIAGIALPEARMALDMCREQGLINSVGNVEQTVAIALMDEIPVETLSSIRARAARTWMTIGPAYFLAEVQRSQDLGNFFPSEELVELADHAGRTSLSLHDYGTAASLLKMAMNFDFAGEPLAKARQMCNLASALDGLGNVAEAREMLARAATLGELLGDSSLVAAAAVQYALPADWYAGDSRASALLERAASMNLSDSDEIKVLAARSLVEMRIPISPTSDHQQVAWVSRPQVAHPLADEALQRSASSSPEVRSLATLAWRSTHRAPGDLDRRREISRESLNLAQVLRLPSNQVESAIWLAVDAIESADRPLFDEALSVARWVAERDGNPRLLWRAHTLSCGAAHMDNDLEKAEHFRSLARGVGESVSSPGWMAADLLLTAEEILASRNSALIASSLVPEDSPVMANPIGRAVVAMIHAVMGDEDTAGRMVRRSLRQLDIESSYLLVATRCADVVLSLTDTNLAEQIAGLLQPWTGHVAVDSNCWWIDGPVDMWLGALWLKMGNIEKARNAFEVAETIARSMDDVRSLGRLAEFRIPMNAVEDHSHGNHANLENQQPLTERQKAIVRLMSSGLTNRQIADRLSFSQSTVRVETIAIYKTLGVKGRSETIAWASRNLD
jgi:DNA-binding CsgD family transcriptional regulator